MNEVLSEQQQIKFNVFVSDPLVGTRAVKQGWVDGDHLDIWLDGNALFSRPDLILEKRGSSWIAIQVREGIQFQKEGSLVAFYEGRNNLSDYDIFQNELQLPKMVFNYETAYGAALSLQSYDTAYTFEENVFSCSLEWWQFVTDLQVVITDLPADKDYALKMSNTCLTNNKFTNAGRIISLIYYGNQPLALGVANEDGVAFYFGKRNPNISADTEETFTLLSSDGNCYTYSTKVRFTESYRLQAAKIPFSKFTQEYADLGLSVKWASRNVGANNFWESGDYFAWGEIEPKSDYSWKTYKFFTGDNPDVDLTLSKYNTRPGYGPVDDITVLEIEDDAAHANWNGSWRMPTKAEFTELLDTDNCSWVKTTINGVNGYKVTSKKEGHTNNWIFLPFTGYWDCTFFEHGNNSGNYWSSSLVYPGMPSYAEALILDSSTTSTGSVHRNSGYSIRPVCD